MAPTPKIESKKHIARLERERRQTRLIKIIAGLVILSVLLILGYGYLDVNVLQPRRPVAEVNGEKITIKEFQARVQIQRRQLLNNYLEYQQYQQYFGMDVSQQLQDIETKLNVPTIVGKEVLDAMIREALIRQEAAKRGLTVTSEELETFRREQFGFFPDGTYTPTVTPTSVEIVYPTLSAEQMKLVTVTPILEASPTPTSGPTITPPPTATPDLRATPTAESTPPPTSTPRPTATPYTLEGYQKEFATAQAGFVEIGFTEAQYERLFETELLRQKLFQIVTADIPPQEEQVWARHILLADEETAKQVLERLKKGEDFGKVTLETSQDPGSAAAGGDLGWFGKGQMVAPFEEAAFALEIGQISQPVQSSFGWHIIQLLGRTTQPLTAYRYEQVRQDAFEDFLTKLREESDVIIHDDWTQHVPNTPSLQDLYQ